MAFPQRTQVSSCWREKTYVLEKTSSSFHDTCVIVPGQVTVDRMVKEECMATVALEPGIRAMEACAVRAKKNSTAKNS